MPFRPQHALHLTGVLLSLAPLLLPVLNGSDAQAAISGLHWDVPEIVDTAVDGLGPAASTCVVRWNDTWLVVYAKNGEIYARTRLSSGWLPAVQLSDGSATSVRPVTCAGEQLYVFWEDDRRGHREIWSRFWNGADWSAEECVSDDDFASRRPSATHDRSLGGACLVWEDSTDAGFRARARWHVNGEWAQPLTVSSSTSDAREPVVAQLEHAAGLRIIWSDARHGEPEIYTCAAYGPGLLSAEERLTYLAGACRRPSVHAERAWIGDWVYDHVVVGFEVRPSGAQPEIYRMTYDQESWNLAPLTVVDGSPSIEPGAAGFLYPHASCGVDQGIGLDLITWSEPVISGRTRTILARIDGNYAQLDTLTTAGLSPVFVVATAGEPEAELLAVWIETVSGAQKLLARHGSQPGCRRTEIQRGPALLIAPEGVPPTILQALNACTGEPVEGEPLQIAFFPALDLELTWDPEQEHPTVHAITDADGNAAFSIRGGGCSQAGMAVAGCDGSDSGDGPSWGGARSPDVDGNCIVDLGDLDYVRLMAGTTDFCADLNGSGQVDDLDVAIVEATLGDHCSGVAALEDDEPDDAIPSADGLTSGGPALRIWPNPAGTMVRLELSLRSSVTGGSSQADPESGSLAAAARIEIFDVGGRLIRTLPLGGASMVLWDLRDEQDTPVPSGVYFAHPRAHGQADNQRLARTILITR